MTGAPRRRVGAAALVVLGLVALPASGSGSADPVFRVSGGAVQEGNAGTTNAVFTIETEIVPLQLVSVGFATRDGTATTPADYRAATGTVDFGQRDTSTSKTVTVAVVGDTEFEADETFSLALTSATAGQIQVAEAQMTIRNDDPKVCRCTQVRARLGKGKFFAKDTGPQVYFTYRFPVVWAITCSEGDVVDCLGEVRTSTKSDDVEIRDARGKPSRGKAISCRGKKCAFTTIGREEIQVRVTGSKRRKGLFLKNKVVRVHLDRRCLPGGALQRTTATIVFNGSTFNAKESDLDGNGAPDG